MGLLFSVVGLPTSLLLTVRADNDEEYVQFNDYETAQAYRFWSLYGLTPDTSSSYTQTYSTNGTFTSTANVSLSGTSTSGGSLNTDGIRLSLLEDFKSNEIASLASIDVAELLNTLKIKVEADHDDRRDQMSLHFGACHAIGQATNSNGNYTSYNITCDGSTDNYYYNNASYNITIDDWTSSDPHTVMQWSISPKTDVYWEGNAPYSAYSHENGDFSGVGQINLSQSMSESGSIVTNGSLTFTTTTTNTNSLKYVYPFVKGTINNAYGSNVTITKRFNNRPDDPFTVIILSTSGTYLYGDHVYEYYSSAWNDEGNLSHANRYYIGGWFVQKFEFYDTNAGNRPMYVDFRNLTSFIPVYSGYKNSMSNDLYRWLYGSDREIEAIQTQTQQEAQQHEEVMSTDEISNLGDVSDGIIDTGTEKMGDLLFPIQHVIDTADELANVNATGQVRLPAIFANDEYWVLDLTVFERKLPQAWTFIQSLCQLAVAIYMIHGLYNLIAGGLNDDS